MVTSEQVKKRAADGLEADSNNDSIENSLIELGIIMAILDTPQVGGNRDLTHSSHTSAIDDNDTSVMYKAAIHSK